MTIPLKPVRALVATLVAAALAAAGALALPSRSAAAPTAIDRLNVVPSPWLGPVLDDLVGGRPLGRLLKDVLCPPVGEVDELVHGAPGLSDLTGLLETGACNLDVLDHRYRTAYRRPDGTTLVREVPAVVNVPAFLDADGAPGPEFVATIRVLGPNELVMQVSRISSPLSGGVQKALPASVEAIVADPTKGSLGRQRIAYGYDARRSSAPTEWETVLRLTDVFGSPDPVRLGVDFKQRGATGPVAVVGELYDPAGGTVGRANRMGGEVRFHQPPAVASVDLALGARIDARVRTTAPTRTDVLARMQDGDEETLAEATVDRLPSAIDLAYVPGPEGRVRVDYDADAPIEALDVRYARRSGGAPFPTLDSRIQARVTNIPRGLTFEQRGRDDFRVRSRGGGDPGAPLELLAKLQEGDDETRIEATVDELPSNVTVDFAVPGEDRLRVAYDADAPIDALDARYSRRTGAPTYGTVASATEAHLRNVPRGLLLEQRGTDDLRVGTRGGGTPDRPFEVLAKLQEGDHESRIEATVDRLPRDVSVALVKPGADRMRVDYRAGDPIAALDARFTQRTGAPHYQRVTTTAEAHARDVPVGLTVEQAGRDDFRAETHGGRIGAIEAGFSTHGAPITEREAGHYVRVVQDGEHTSLAGRVLGFRRARFTGAAPMVVEGELEPGPVRATVHTPELDAEATIRDLPAKARLVLDLARPRVIYDGDGSGIAEIALRAQTPKPLFARATQLEATIREIPATLQLDLRQSGGDLELVSDSPIGSIELLASDGHGERLPAGEQGVILRDEEDRWLVFGRIEGLQQVRLRSEPLDVLVRAGAGRPFTAAATVRQPGDDLQVRGRIENLPKRVRIGLQQDPGAGTTLSYDADAPIGRVLLEGENLELARAEDFRAEVRDVPARFDVALPRSGSLLRASASDPIGQIDLQLARGAFAELPAGRDGVLYHDTTRRFAVAARISRLRGVDVATDPLPDIALDLPGAPRPFDVDVEQQRFPDEPVEYVRGAIESPQRDTRVRIETSPTTRLHYAAGEPIDRIAMRSNVGGLGLIDTTVRNVPRTLSICFDSGPRCRRAPSPHADALVSADIDDGGTANGPIELDGLICLEPDDEADCGTADRRRKVVTIDGLKVRNLAFDVFSDGIDSKAFIDTDNWDIGGSIEYRDAGLPIIDGVRVRLPAGFRAQDRRAGILGSSGTIACPAGTTIGTIGPSINLAGLLCP